MRLLEQRIPDSAINALFAVALPDRLPQSIHGRNHPVKLRQTLQRQDLGQHPLNRGTLIPDKFTPSRSLVHQHGDLNFATDPTRQFITIIGEYIQGCRCYGAKAYKANK